MGRGRPASGLFIKTFLRAPLFSSFEESVCNAHPSAIPIPSLFLFKILAIPFTFSSPRFFFSDMSIFFRDFCFQSSFAHWFFRNRSVIQVRYLFLQAVRLLLILFVGYLRPFFRETNPFVSLAPRLRVPFGLFLITLLCHPAAWVILKNGTRNKPLLTPRRPSLPIKAARQDAPQLPSPKPRDIRFFFSGPPGETVLG